MREEVVHEETSLLSVNALQADTMPRVRWTAVPERSPSSLLPTRELRHACSRYAHFYSILLSPLKQGAQMLTWHAMDHWYCTSEEMDARMQATPHDMNVHEHAWHTSMALAGMSWHPQPIAWHRMSPRMQK